MGTRVIACGVAYSSAVWNPLRQLGWMGSTGRGRRSGPCGKPHALPGRTGRRSRSCRLPSRDGSTVGHGHPPALRCAADSFGADRLVFGTDFRYETGAVFERGQLHHGQRPGPGDVDRVLSVNAEALISWRDP